MVPGILKKLLLLLAIAGLQRTCFAQTDSKIDSLLTMLNNQKDDTARVNTLNALSKQFLSLKNFSAAKSRAENALQLAEHLKFKKGTEESYTNLGNSHNRRGASYYYEGNYPEALQCYLEALTSFEKGRAKKGMANAYRNIGLVYWVRNNFAEALIKYSTSLRILEELKDTLGIAAAYNDLGNAYENNNNPIEALKNYHASLALYEQMNDKTSMINRYFNIGFLYENRENFTDALKNFSAALKISEELKNDEAIAGSYINIGDMYYHQSKAEPLKKEQLLNEALKGYRVSLEKYKALGYNEELAICYNALGRTYFELKDYSRARQFLNGGLALLTKVKRDENSGEYYQLPVQYIAENYLLLEKLDSATGSWKSAYTNHKLYVRYRDSLTREENSGKILRTQMEYDFGRKKDSLIFQQKLSEEKLSKQSLLTRDQKNAKNYILAGTVLLCILAFFIYKNYRTRQQLKLQQLRNKIATDLHDDVGSTLSSISMFSQMAQQQSKESIPLLDTIGENSRKMLDAMADIVWAIQPENDQFEQIILRMRNFAFDLLGARNIDFEFDADEDVNNMKLSMNYRRNIYLIFKEATNNMVKYSATDKALFILKREKDNLTMLIRDNGKGFDTSQSTTGNGIKNMKKRAEEMGARLMIESGPGIGTTIELKMIV